MSNSTMRWIFALAAVLGMRDVSLAQTSNTDIPLTNWTVPPYATSAAGLRTMTDQTPPRAFIGLPPCRLLDTRPPANNPLDGDGQYQVDQTRTYTLPGNCGLPTGTDAVSLNMSVTNTGGQPFGHLKVWPTGVAEPNVSTLNYPGAGATLANAAIVPLGTDAFAGQINVKSGNATADVLMDVNGYFSDVLGTTGNYLELTSSAAGQGTILGRNTSTTTGSSGVYGLASATSGAVFGVFGRTSSPSLDSAGVKGIDASGSPTNATSFLTAGVRGESLSNFGVLGISQLGAGVQGTLVNSSGAALAEGKLGVLVGGTYYALYAATGDVGVTGTKSFVVPHPTEPGIVIRYVSLEGPEAGTYFRGRARIQGREAVIEVPEIFRLVTEGEGLSVQVTSIGGPASLWVEELGLDRIVIRGIRDTEFFYTVNGVRKGYGSYEPLIHSSEFVPGSASARLPEGLSPETKRRLIANGTYNPDGTVNMETAERMGWTRIWATRNEAH